MARRNNLAGKPMSSMQNQFTVHFWGVRGSIASPGAETVRYGGNTPCIEMRVGDSRLIFDGGTGLRVLGQTLLSQMPVKAHIFFTHSHWDHIQGFPFFVPAFIQGNCFQDCQTFFKTIKLLTGKFDLSFESSVSKSMVAINTNAANIDVRHRSF